MKFEISVIIIWLICLVGWVANLVKLIGMIGGDVTTMFILRIVGLFAAPVGTILGFV